VVTLEKYHNNTLWVRERARAGEESGRVQKIENVERHEGGFEGVGLWGICKTCAVHQTRKIT